MSVGSLRCALAALVLVSGCGRTPEAPSLSVTQFRHDGAAGVLLNEGFTVHFSAELDRRSVTAHSVRVVSASGQVVAGELRTELRTLSFEPALPTDSELSNGSFRPGERYSVELLGFPRVDALRSRDGAPLQRTYRAEFTTVGPDSERPFTDDYPDFVAQLSIPTLAVAPGQPWVLECPEPIDPRSVGRGAFELVPSWIDDATGSALQRIRLRARLVENASGRARIELMPLGDDGLPRLLPRGEYRPRRTRGTPPPRDLGGNEFRLSPIFTDPSAPPLVVTDPLPVPAGPRFLETFATTDFASPRAVEGSVGEARWQGDGRVRLVLPRSVGDGSDGSVELTSAGERTHWSATDLALPSGAEVVFQSAGLVVVASQGTLEIDGRVVRRVQPPEASRGSSESLESWQRRLRAQPSLGVGRIVFDEHESLSSFLERAARTEQPYTCFIAGGDLVVRGEVDCDGPLLLVSGGRVRIPGRVWASDVWMTAPHAWSAVVSAWTSSLPIEIDAPDTNPLALDQTWSVVSGPIRPGGDFDRWRTAEVVGHAGIGRYEVSYIGLRAGSDGRMSEIGPVADPRLLEDCPLVRIRIDLTVPATDIDVSSEGAVPRPGATTWDPPWIDEVELVWEVRRPATVGGR